MRRLLVLQVFVVNVLVLTAAPPSTPAKKDATPTRIVGYFPEWSVPGRKAGIADLPADKLTHINYAFARIHDGECALNDARAAVERVYPGDDMAKGALHGHFNQLRKLKAKHPHLKTLLSVGGWTLSGEFSDAALSEQSRGKFARSAVAFLPRYGFDGIDIDWEFPVGGGLEKNKARPEDKRNFTLLLAALRKELDARGKADSRHYLLTIAAPAGPKTYANMELDRIAPLLDWINLMTYDFHGSWSPLTNFNAPLYASKDDPATDETVRRRFNVDAAVQGYLDAGVPADKIVVGVPFYGHGWGGVKDVNHGLYQPHGRTAPHGGSWDYRDLAANYLGKLPRYWHADAKVPWLYDAKNGVMISYDDAESLKLKAEYVRQKKLGGAMIWELTADAKDWPLLDALHGALRGK